MTHHGSEVKMSFFDKMTSKFQDTAAATKLLAKLKSGNQISKQVLDAYLKQDLPKVISLIESILTEEPDERKTEAYLTLSQMCFNAKNYDLTEECINKSLSIKKTGKAYELLGELKIQCEKKEEAIEPMIYSIQLNNDTENVYLSLIQIYKENKDYLNLMDMIWKYIQKYNKSDWAWETNYFIFDQPNWNGFLNLKTPGSALSFILNFVMQHEKPEKVINLSDSLASRPFPIFNTSMEKAAYHWIRAVNYNKLRLFADCANEWYLITRLPDLPSEIKKWSYAEWRANELAGHFDPQVLNKIITREETAIKGQFMKATVLICDIRGFSRFSYEFRHAPQVILQFLQPYFDSSQDIILSHNGILDKYLGDGFISFFIPASQDETGYNDSVTRTVKSALELQKYFSMKFPEWAEIWKRNLEEITNYDNIVNQIGIGIGIHTGFMFLGEVGTGKRRQYTVLGNVVNFTARLQGKAKRGQIVISAPIYEYIKNIELGYKIFEMPEEAYSELKNIPGSYNLYYIDCNK